MKELVKKIKCERCGWVWIPRINNIIRCAKCKSKYYNKKK